MPTQTEAIVFWSLSFNNHGSNHNPSLRTLITGELWTGFLIGCALTTLSLPLILLVFGNFKLAIAVALTIISAGIVANGIGLLFPWWLNSLGKDPALGSGLVATIIQDILSLVIYFLIVQWINV